MNKQLFSKRYRYFMLIATLLMLVSVVSPTFATYSNSTITYSVAILAKCAVNSGHWSLSHGKLGNSHYTYGGSSTTYSITFGAAATIETDSHWKSGNTQASSLGINPAATVPVNNVSVQRVQLNRGTNPIFSGSSAGSTFLQNTTTSFAGTGGSARLSNNSITLSIPVAPGTHPPSTVNKLTMDVVFKNNTTGQLIYRTVSVEGMPTTCNSSTPTFYKITSEAPKKW